MNYCDRVYILHYTRPGFASKVSQNRNTMHMHITVYVNSNALNGFFLECVMKKEALSIPPRSTYLSLLPNYTNRETGEMANFNICQRTKNNKCLEGISSN